MKRVLAAFAVLFLLSGYLFGFCYGLFAPDHADPRTMEGQR